MNRVISNLFFSLFLYCYPLAAQDSEQDFYDAINKAESVETAVTLIKTQTPDLVLLDIELADGSGFEILQKLQPYSFKVVFITGFDAFTIQAFKYSALIIY
ncbi:MAG: response regulator [Bacteroidales bacterium]|jgi:DNA-binding LytR/AlgR family response regulator|nr:response regulator [Bacteroidales bacterium]HOI31638.1 response regulator [Bacteroidales bacterium]